MWQAHTPGTMARALAAEPVIILPDEPTANLDSKAGAALMDISFAREM